MQLQDIILEIVIPLLGGLALFLFGMNTMSDGLEKSAGGALKNILEKMTSNKFLGFLLGAGVTAVIQSSSATTVMVVGFVNSGIMSLKQAINIIIGANVGTTITSWILSLSGLDGDALWIQILKPSTFSPLLAIAGIAIMMFAKSSKKKDIATILIGFGTLMIGMDLMSSAVSPLKEIEGFRNILTMFENPVLGVLAGAILTAVIQSSSASVGILQAVSSTGQLSMVGALPIIMGQNIGTCVTAMISSVGTNKNARRTAVVHLYFNIVGTVVMMILFYTARAIFDFNFLNGAANEFNIAVMHTIFNIVCTAIMLPLSSLLEKLAYLTIKDEEGKKDKIVTLDERLYTTPAVAVNRASKVACEMADIAFASIKKSIELLYNYNEQTAQEIMDEENIVDKYEDKIGTYLVKLNSHSLSEEDNRQSAQVLHLIGDYERVSDHAVNLVNSAKEINEKKITFSEQAQKELSVMVNAINEIADLTIRCYQNNDVELAKNIEPLEQVVDVLKEQLKHHHIQRLSRGECTIETGFVLNDIITNLERVSDHCSNIAGCIIELSHSSLGVHKYLGNVKTYDQNFRNKYEEYLKKYSIEQ